MNFLGPLLFLLMGLSLGLIGTGGAILAIPLLVYILHIPILLATTYSLFIVGMTALGGVILRLRTIAYKQIASLAIPSVMGVFIARMWIIPYFPNDIGGFSRDSLLKVLLVSLMFLASYFMLKNHDYEKKYREFNEFLFIKIAFYGLSLGLIMGLLGAGGGFLMIPVLVLFLDLDMKTAVGTSLFIIMTNSLVGFLADQQDLTWNNYKVLISYTALSLSGMAIGTYLSSKIAGATLKKGFGWFVAILATSIAIKELWC